MTSSNRRLRLALVLGALGLGGCDRRTPMDLRRPRAPALAQGTWVARYGGDTLTDRELAARLAELGAPARARFQAPAQRRDYVDGLVRYDLLAREAVRQGLAADPEVVEATRRALVQQLLRREVELPPEAVGEAEVKAHYERHRDDYQRPRLTRLAILRLDREERARAEALLAAARALPPLDLAGFGRLAREHSRDERSRVLDGDLRFATDQELAALHGPELARAAAALERPGDLAPGLVETATGLYLVKLQARQPALDLSLEQARASIRQVLAQQARGERLHALLARVTAEASVELDEAALAAVPVDPRAEAAPATLPAPGYFPAPPPPPGAPP